MTHTYNSDTKTDIVNSCYNNLDNLSPKILQPDNVLIELKEHQKTIIHAMLQLEEKGCIAVPKLLYFSSVPTDYNISTTVGILGDRVGAGKSLDIITLVSLNKSPKKRDVIYESSKYISIKEITDTSKYIDTNLLVVPHKILSQWVNFFNYAPHLKLYTIAHDSDFNSLNIIDNHDVILIACTKYEQFETKYSNYKWNRLIIDEADTIKLPKKIEITTNFLWLVTGTPSGILYANKPYINNIFNKNKVWLLDHLTVKNSKEYIDTSIILPTPKRIYIKCLTPNELNVIKELIPKNILEMINAGNTDEAIKLLNYNENTQDNIIKVLTRNIMQTIDNKNIEIEAEKKKKMLESEKEKKINVIQKSIERLNIRLETIKKKVYELNDEYCPICMDSFTKPVIIDCCKNLFCFECLAMCLGKQSACPFCREKVGINDIHIINPNKSNDVNDETTKKKSEKIYEKNEILIELIKNSYNSEYERKFLVFANYNETFKKIENEFVKNNITYRILKGSDVIVNKYIEEFKNNRIKVLLMNAQYFGAGMNLQMATDIVIYHRFTKEMEEQIIGRAHRMGRDISIPLSVYYLLHNNENNSVTSDMKFDDIEYDDYMETYKNIDPEDSDQIIDSIVNDNIDVDENIDINMDVNIDVEIQKKNKPVIVKHSKKQVKKQSKICIENN